MNIFITLTQNILVNVIVYTYKVMTLTSCISFCIYRQDIDMPSLFSKWMIILTIQIKWNQKWSLFMKDNDLLSIGLLQAIVYHFIIDLILYGYALMWYFIHRYWRHNSQLFVPTFIVFVYVFCEEKQDFGARFAYYKVGWVNLV